MLVQREAFYFEPRCINEYGIIRWYGERYQPEEIFNHSEETVYIRDNGKELYVYSLVSDECAGGAQIKAVFTLICKIKKHSDKWKYGRKNI